MRIENMRTEENGDRKRIAATVHWEDSGRTSQEIFFETEAEFADSIWCNPNAFLIPCTISAMRFGERRVFMDEEACPELQEGLYSIMSWFRHWYHWYGPKKELVHLETKRQSRAPVSANTERTGFLFSGGIDSLATLRYNRLNYSPEHPGYIKDGVIVCGVEIANFNEEYFRHFRDSIMPLAAESDITVVTVYTNIRELEPASHEDFQFFWADEFEMAAFSGVAHALSKRFSRFIVNSTYDIPNLMPASSHPLIDPNYSSFDLRIRHFGETLSRLEKTKLVSDWNLALRYMRVCNRAKINYQPGLINCGKCEKCLYSMLGLLAVGALEKAEAFNVHEITADMVHLAVGHSRYTEFPFYAELKITLAEKGRHDLVRAIKRIEKRYHAFQWKNGWKERIKEFDRRHLNNKLIKLKRTLVNQKDIV
jgi:hypothetical protein